MRLPAPVRALVVALAGWTLAYALAQVGVVGDLLLALERTSLDYRMGRYRGPRLEAGAAPSDVVVVAIDEASLRELGRFALWPRAYHAALLDRLARAGARAVAFDVLFTEPDTLPDAVADVRAAEIAAGTGLDAPSVRSLLGAWGGDDRFAARMRASGIAVLAADPGAGALPVPVLAGAAAAVGHVSMAPDPDGVLRSVATRAAPDDTLPPLAWSVARVAGIDGAGPAAGRVALDFLGPRGTFLTLSYADVLAGRVQPALLRGRIALVGATAAGLGDLFTTPFSEDFPGVEAHATLVQQILDGRALRPAGLPGTAAGLALVLVAALAVTTLGPGASVLVAGGAAVVYVLGSFEAFAQADQVVPFAFPLFAWTTAVLLAGAWRYGTEQRGRRDLQRAFSRYVAPDVVADIARRPEALALGGAARVVTVGFVDIRGFTALAARMEPEALVRFLHAFFSAVEAEIHAHRGTVDKYVGDAVMMLFGAPAPLDDAPLAACRTALAVVEAVRARAEEWRALGVPELRVGIGLETGGAVVGNFGSERRFDYTALGDTVNIASRLQDLNKALGTTVLIGPGTRAAVADALPVRALGSHALRGREAPVPVFELVPAGAGPTPP